LQQPPDVGPGVIDRPELLTAEWVAAALGASGRPPQLVGIDVEPVGTGQMGVSARVRLHHAPGSEGPATVVAKFPATDPAARPLASSAYRTEIDFYRTVAPTVSVATPECLYAASNEDSSEFVLVMSDLAPAVPGDQLAGCGPDHARAALVNLAGLHAPRWCDPTLGDLGFLDVTEDGIVLLEVVYGEATTRFVDLYGDRLGAGDTDVLGDVASAIGDWLRHAPARESVLHGDYRLDNLLFDDRPGADRAVVAVDWQTTGVGLPGRDVAYFIETSLAPETRRTHERGLVAAYHGALVALGVADHPLDECWDDVRYGALQGPLVTVLGAAFSQRTDRGDDMFVAMASRSCDAIRDLGTLALI
jgi:hypothetical protein